MHVLIAYNRRIHIRSYTKKPKFLTNDKIIIENKTMKNHLEEHKRAAGKLDRLAEECKSDMPVLDTLDKLGTSGTVQSDNNFDTDCTRTYCCTPR